MPKTAAAPAKKQAQTDLKVPTDLSNDAVAEISTSLCHLLADVFVLYLKTKNFHWHMTGRHFGDYIAAHMIFMGHNETDSVNRNAMTAVMPIFT